MVSPQQPIGSPFGYRSSASEVVADQDLTDTVAVVTGGYSGIGTETVRALAASGARVFVGARRPDVAQDVLGEFAGDIVVLPLDLAAPASIAEFSVALKQQATMVHRLINNAAVMACPLSRDTRGYESQFATNHLGHFGLTAELWPLLVVAGGARVVTLSSSGHARNGLDLDDVNFERRDYDKWVAYGQAKSANALFALQLDKLGAPMNVRAFAVDPGAIQTPLQRHLTMEEQIGYGWYDEDGNLNPLFKTTEQGASTTVWCATSPLLEGQGGVYCANCEVAAPWQDGDPPYVGVHPHVRDEETAASLWALSEQMTGGGFS